MVEGDDRRIGRLDAVVSTHHDDDLRCTAGTPVSEGAGGWEPGQLQQLASAVELEVAARRADGALGRWTPVWVVRVGTDVFVRSWYRRETGWFGHAVATGRARVRVPGVEADVAVVDLGGVHAGEHDDEHADEHADEHGAVGELRELLAAVDEAYRTKYGAHGDAGAGSMVSARARATTLRLDRR